jgi:DNA-binding NarL/FixJ family response regulator
MPAEFNSLGTSKKIKIAVACGCEKLRKAIVHLLSSHNELQIVILAEKGENLLGQLNGNCVDILLVDVRMTLTSGVRVAKIIKEKYCYIKIIAIAQYDDEADVIEMGGLGVKSYIGMKYFYDIGKVLKIVSEGGVYFPDEIGSIIQAI